MNNEIKEILESLDKIANQQYYPEDLLYYENCKLLLDYITNLQQAVKNTKETADDMLYELNEENERLKEDLKGQENLAMAFSKTSHDYYQRIDKAIEYIENDTFKCKNQEEQLNYDYDLLDILRGDDK